MDQSSAQVLSKDTGTSPCSGERKAIIANNLTNSTWDGFGQSSRRNASNFRTPSPFTQGPVGFNSSTGTGGHRSEKHQRKRSREGSLSIGNKRSRYPHLVITDRGNDWGNIEIVDDDAQYDVYRGSPSPRGREATADELDHGVIILDHDDELDELIETSSTNWSHVSNKKGPPSLNPDYLLLDLDDDEDRLFEEVEMQDPRESPLPGRSGTITASRNPAITPPWAVEESIETNAAKFEVGDVVELKSSGFLRISIIMKNLQTDHVKFRGCRLERTRALNGILPKKRNELYWNVEIELDDLRPPMIQGMEEIDLGEVLCVRNTRITNQLFPSCSYREIGGYYDDATVELTAPCAVRWMYSCKYLTARDRWHNRWDERSVELLKEKDFSKGDRLALVVSNAKVRTRYRGNTILGGSYPGLAKQDGTKSFIINKSRKISDKPTVLVVDDEPEVEQLRRSVSVVQLSNKSEEAYSSNHECRDVLDRQLQQNSLSLSHKIIDLSDSWVSASPNEGVINASNAQPPGSAARKHSIRVPGQKYTYGDCCKLHLQFTSPSSGFTDFSSLRCRWRNSRCFNGWFETNMGI